MGSVEDFMNTINKNYGEGSVMNMESESFDVEAIPTGSLSIDTAFGVGGFPKGRITELMGWEGSSKTTITLHAVAEAQKMGERVLLIDAEHALDRKYMRNLGIDTSDITISQPDCGEDALNILEKAVREGIFGLVVLDSVAALVPKKELQGDVGEANIGLQARMMSQAMRKITGVTNKSNTAVVFINQFRQKIGVMYGSDEVTTGGNALKFYASIRAKVWRSGGTTKDDDGKSVSNHYKLKTIKNKLSPPFVTVEYDVNFGEGIDKAGEIVDFAEEYGIIERGGSWYKYDGQTIAQGKDKMRQFFKDNPEFYEEIRKKVKEEYEN